MRNFRITVNGNTYDVAVEEVGASAPAFTAAAQVSAAPVQAPAAPAAPVQAPAAGASASGTKVTSPMPGKVLDIKVSEGAAVKKGDVLLTFEAMKMENEIVSPKDGKVETIAVQKGANIESGDFLVSIV